MTNLTFRDLCALPVEDQLRLERISIMVIDGGLSEDEAVSILDQRQGELFTEKG